MLRRPAVNPIRLAVFRRWHGVAMAGYRLPFICSGDARRNMHRMAMNVHRIGMDTRVARQVRM
jgi:hypothetical protein